jgi:hypothetical protein
LEDAVVASVEARFDYTLVEKEDASSASVTAHFTPTWALFL